MKRKTIVYILSFVVFATSLEFDETCEKRQISPMNDFNLIQHIGPWHVSKRYNNNLESKKCNAVVSFKGETSTDFSVEITPSNLNGTAKLVQKNDTTPTTTQSTNTGSEQSTQTNNNETTGIPNFTTENATETKKLANFIITFNNKEEYSFVVLNTDYISYSLVWMCRNLPSTNKSSQIVWVLSRNSTPADSLNVPIVDTTLAQNNINKTLLIGDDTCNTKSGCATIILSMLLLPLLPLIFSV